MDADGNNHEMLEDNAWGTSWSPDGKQIAFVSLRDGLGEIYVIGVGGQGRNRVTQDLVAKLSPSFSPDGRRDSIRGGAGARRIRSHLSGGFGW